MRIFVPLLLLLLVVASGCSHVVLIKTDPPGARVMVDGELKGVSPIFFEEATGPGSSYEIRIDLEGYESERITLQQNNWWSSCVWPSLCLLPFTCGGSGLGLLFARSLEDEYTFLLQRVAPASPSASTGSASAPGSQPALRRPPASSQPSSAPGSASRPQG